ncbi:MAG: general secretion pathway protein GspK [Syntrophorhabdaceae bacterium]|nr:general secretion pathway protein GspK [Syntrophorhabdaceae bacterium]
MNGVGSAGSERGFALLVTLWVVIILMTIVMSLSLLAKAEAYATLYFRQSFAARLLAEAGLERAIMEIYYRQANMSKTIIPESGEAVRVDGTEIEGALGDDRYIVRIFNEAGRININTMNDQNKVIFNNLLVSLGVLKETADTIVDSALDWMDKDNLHRLHGAEDEHYQSLPNPYKAKNAPFDTAEELLLVKGVTEDILFGTKERNGLIQFITVYGNSSRINVNVAPKEVLMALPDMTEETADRIISQRLLGELRSLEDVRGLMGALYDGASGYIDTGESMSFTIESSGIRKNGGSGYGIRATVVVQSGGEYRYVSYKTPAEVRR